MTACGGGGGEGDTQTDRRFPFPSLLFVLSVVDPAGVDSTPKERKDSLQVWLKRRTSYVSARPAVCLFAQQIDNRLRGGGAPPPPPPLSVCCLLIDTLSLSLSLSWPYSTCQIRNKTKQNLLLFAFAGARVPESFSERVVIDFQLRDLLRHQFFGTY